MLRREDGHALRRGLEFEAESFFVSFFCHRFLQMLFIFMLCHSLLTHGLFNSCIICIMHSAFNLLVFPNSMFTPLLLFLFFNERAMCSPEK